ncbi:polysaccharide lyase family 7 protein [Flammeovirgaceae bacterium SG7u.111]|nr:polysaccharide lyase family 7 protein [Flammeovirgaceae bacterium SG7u.132]WPO37025.1 polysaccharide lyase family 7 protein [Flammeovirgaceae bacterium SG7u.111]
MNMKKPLLLSLLIVIFCWQNIFAQAGEVNLALNGTATQSSTAYSGAAARAIDGNTSGSWANGSVTHTANEANPWWQVDLGTTQSIGNINLFNRTNSCCQDRLTNFTVSVINSSGNTTFSQSFTSYPDPSITVNADGASGNTIKVQLDDTNALSLAEVEVFAYEGSAESVNIPVLSSTASGEQIGNGKENATDDNLDTRWSAQGTHNIDLNLGSTHVIDFLKIAFFKGDTRGTYYSVAVSSDGTNYTTIVPQTTSSGTTADFETIDFGNTTAQYVRITGYGNSSGNGWTSLSEVEVWGYESNGPVTEYTLTVTNGSGDGHYTEGTNVSISANAAPSGQEFDQWTGDVSHLANVNNASTSVTMPSSNIGVTATYKDVVGNPVPVTLDNPGFESDWSGWSDSDPSAISGVANSGSKAAKVSGSGGGFEQTVSVTPNSNYRLTAYLTGSGQIGAKVGSSDYSTTGSNSDWTQLEVTFNSGGASSITIYGAYYSAEGRFDDFELWALSGGTNPTTYQLTVNSGSGDGSYAAGASVSISADAAPSGQVFDKWTGNTSYLSNINSSSTNVTMPSANVSVTATYKSSGSGNADVPSDILPSLDRWKLTLPFNEDGDDSNSPVEITNYDDRLRDPEEIKDGNLIGYELADYFEVRSFNVIGSSQTFDAVVFRAHCAGVTTENSGYPRCELRQRYNGEDGEWSFNNEQSLTADLIVTHLPVEKPEISVVQVKGGTGSTAGDEALRVQYHSSDGLYIVYNEDYNTKGNSVDYALGERLRVSVNIPARDGKDMEVDIINLDRTDGSGDFYFSWDVPYSIGYFKLGCYTQSSVFLSQFKDGKNDEARDAYGEMAVLSMSLVEDGGAASRFAAVSKPSLSDPLASEDFVVYPNPTISELNVSLPTLIQDDRINIYNLTGKKVFTQKVVQGMRNLQLNLQGLTKGMYFIELENTNINRQKLILN